MKMRWVRASCDTVEIGVIVVTRVGVGAIVVNTIAKGVHQVNRAHWQNPIG